MQRQPAVTVTMAATIKLNRVQQDMLEVLSDGNPHSASELHDCLFDELGSISNIHAHLTKIRKYLAPEGETVLCVMVHNVVHYQHVRMINR